ncbi:DUF2293 domain-containing protein [Cohaesibacter celericrescens]|uniref:DUF2293 domain-containing protein n=1 Tax=Cohaesibacter celericrescens TaxID=2067669 RepID=UPI00356B4061
MNTTDHKKRTKRFQRKQIETALSRHFPYCPEDHRIQIIDNVLAKDWDKKTSMTQAVSIVVHNHIRHQMTDYENLIGKSGILREETRIIVKPELDDWFEYWHSGTDTLKP